MRKSPLLRSKWFDALAVVLAFLLIVGAQRANRAAMGNDAYLTGYIATGLVLLLAALNWRKKLSLFSFGKVSTWLRIHVAMGFLVIGVFGLHAGVAWPNGWFETTLYFVFVLTIVSGLVGLYISRQHPLKLAKLREEYIYERIPAFRAEVRRRAHAVVLNLVEEAPADTIADFYTTALTPYFVCGRGSWYFLRPNSAVRNELQSRLNALTRYCTKSEKEAQQQLSRLIDKRDDLDYHSALQGQLKWWLFGHIALTYALLMLVAIHFVLVHAFHGAL